MMTATTELSSTPLFCTQGAGPHAMQRLVFLPWSGTPSHPNLQGLQRVCISLLSTYSQLWSDAGRPTYTVKNLSKLLEGRWEQALSIKQLEDAGEEILHQLARLHKARYLLSAHLSTLPQQPEGDDTLACLQVEWLLYDAHTEQWALQYKTPLPYFEPAGNTLDTLAPTVWSLEDLMRGISLNLLAFFNPPDAVQRLSDLTPFKLNAPYALLRRWVEAEAQSTTPLRLEALKALLPIAPHHHLVHWSLAKQYKLNRQYAQAKEHLISALSSPHFPQRFKAQLLNELGSCSALIGDQEQALDAWLHAVEEDPTHVLTHMNIAHAYEELGQEEQSEQHLRKVLQVSPADGRVYYSLARIYSCQGRWPEALAQYQLQLLLDPTDPWCHNNIATTCLQQNRLPQAKHHLQRACALDPEGEAGQYAQLVLSGLLLDEEAGAA